MSSSKGSRKKICFQISETPTAHKYFGRCLIFGRFFERLVQSPPSLNSPHSSAPFRSLSTCADYSGGKPAGVSFSKTFKKKKTLFKNFEEEEKTFEEHYCSVNVLWHRLRGAHLHQIRSFFNIVQKAFVLNIMLQIFLMDFLKSALTSVATKFYKIMRKSVETMSNLP